MIMGQVKRAGVDIPVSYVVDVSDQLSRLVSSHRNGWPNPTAVFTGSDVLELMCRLLSLSEAFGRESVIHRCL